jgi:hypothetical protein
MYDANIHIFFGELMVIEPAKPLYRRVYGTHVPAEWAVQYGM